MAQSLAADEPRPSDLNSEVDALRAEAAMVRELLRKMEDQHKAVMAEVKRGKYAPEGEKTEVQDLSLDEIVLAYLAARFANK